MGLSNALSGGIILFGVTYVIFSFAGFTDIAASFSEVSSQTSDLESKLIKTSIDVNIDPAYIIGTDEFFSFNVTNTNLEKLWEFDKFDVIVTYNNSGTTYTELLTHDSLCPENIGGWCIDIWHNDVLDPKILNNDEIMTINATVNRSLDLGSDLMIVVSTPNGVVASVTTTV